MGPTLSFRFASHRCYILNLFLFHCGVNMGRGKKKDIVCVCLFIGMQQITQLQCRNILWILKESTK